MKYIIVIVCSLLNIFLVSHAYANAYSSSSLSAFQYDLTCNEGIVCTPSITWQGAVTEAHANIDYPESGVIVIGVHPPNLGDYVPVSDVASGVDGKSSASVIGSYYVDAATHSNGDSLGNKLFYSSGAYAYGEFILSAYTQVTFSVWASLHAGVSGLLYNGSNDEEAFAEAELKAALYNGNQSIDAGEVTANNYYIDEKYDSGQLIVTISNPFAEAISGYVRGTVKTYGYSNQDYIPTSQVPAPASLPLMAAALGLFGLAKRRKTANYS